VAKRNQYNRSTLPQDMAITLYSPTATVVTNGGAFTINPDCGVVIYAGNGTGTGSLDITGMKNGQRIDIVNATEQLLRINATAGKFMVTNFATASTTVMVANTSVVAYKFDSAPIADGSTQSNLLLMASSASFNNFPA
jgi:hypothetical protein